MCGIIGYTGHRPSVPVIIEGLKRLEYRGYDSAGIAFCVQHRLEVYKSEGKLHKLEEKLSSEGVFLATTGIGHTRWATHGLPTAQNAHPHLSQNKNIALVHNGIIENFAELKKLLQDKGIKFNSDTDTEVIVQLLGYYRDQGEDILTALHRTLAQLEGSYALALIECAFPNTIWAARRSSPLVLGVGQGENFVASDIPAFLPYTRDVIFIEDNEIIQLEPQNYRVLKADDLTEVDKKLVTINWDLQAAQRGGYKHFMLKEIFEQPRVISDCLNGRVDKLKQKIVISEVENLPVPNKIKIIACGTSYHAGLWSRYLFGQLAAIPVDVEIASEFRYAPLILSKDELVVVISQSGETADTLAALRRCQENEVKVLGLCNVVGSSIARESDLVLYTQAGPEISVASTKAMCSQMISLLLLALFWGEQKGLVQSKDFLPDLLSLGDELEQVLPEFRQKAKGLAQKYAWAKNFFYLGRGICFPLALEGALKLKEISYIHAEGYAAGEMKHGPIALIDPKFPTFALAPLDELLPKVKSNLEEVQARGGKIIALSSVGSGLKVDDFWDIPSKEIFTSFFILPCLQLFAYEMAVYLGKDVDQPRNLAKSVTVE